MIENSKLRWDDGKRPFIENDRNDVRRCGFRQRIEIAGERPADVAGETGGAGEPRQHGISDTGDPGEYKAGLEIPNYAVDTDESSDWREGLQTL